MGQGFERKLLSNGTLHSRYWICSYCVNQHSSICGGTGPQPPYDTEAYNRWDAQRRDSVTGEIFTWCTCAEPKYFNAHPVECELNKFDDMMALLHTEAPGFRLLAAV